MNIHVESYSSSFEMNERSNFGSAIESSSWNPLKINGMASMQCTFAFTPMTGIDTFSDTSIARAMKQRLRILFLGNSYNPIGVVCVQTLVELGHEVIVGDYDALTQGGWRFVRKKLKSRGWRLVLNRAAYLIRCKTRIALRRMGVPLSGFASLPEITHACGLNLIQCANPNSAEFVQQVQLLGVQLIVVANFSRILKRALIETPGLGCINVHPSLLPRYRGPEPFYWVLANREKTTGVTLHYMDEGIDSGDIILQRELEIRPKETQTTLSHRSSAIAAELLREAVPLLQAGRAPRMRQDQTAATYYSFPSKGASLPKD